MNRNLFKFINAAAFFRTYLPHIKSVKHKMRGKNGRGNPTDFSAGEKEEIRRAFEKMAGDLLGTNKK